jgi:hypothetical protein
MLTNRFTGAGMPRRLHLGPASGPKALGALAAGVLVVALVVTGRWLSGRELQPSDRPARTTVAEAPYRIGDRVTCPLGRPVLAVSTGRSYPPGHPARPPRDADAVACYGTAGEATAAGYPEAPLPAGTLELDGVYLVPTSAQLRRQCREAADRLGFAVPCPKLRPVPLPGAPPPTVCAGHRPCGDPEPDVLEPEPGFLLEAGGFVVPSGYVGSFGDTGARLAVAAAKRLTAFAVACAGERPVAPARVRGSRGRLVQCPPESGPHRGGTLVRWREEAAVLAVSVTGHTDLERRLVLALAAHLELVPPGG